VLSELQLRVAELISDLPEADEFELTGGGRPILRGKIVRRIERLFFSPSIRAVERPLLRDSLAVEQSRQG
jgi:hypothetical protein